MTSDEGGTIVTINLPTSSVSYERLKKMERRIELLETASLDALENLTTECSRLRETLRPFADTWVKIEVVGVSAYEVLEKLSRDAFREAHELLEELES